MMPRPFRKLMAAAAISAALIAGCDKVKAPPGAQLDKIGPADYPRVVVLDGLDRGVRFMQPTVIEATETTPMRVSTPVRSIEDRYSLNVQYEYEWFDSRGMPVGRSGQVFKSLPSRAQVFLDASALDTNATDWRLIVRPAK